MRKILVAPLTIAFGLLSLVGISVFTSAGLYAPKFGDCVRLPNGTEIGYEAYIDFSCPYFKPVTVLREPDGRVIGQEVFPIHVTEKAAYGSAWIEYENTSADFHFIWTQETGVVREIENPDLYHRLSQDLGETYFGASKDMNVNTLWIFNQLKEQGRFDSDHCNTRLLTW